MLSHDEWEPIEPEEWRAALWAFLENFLRENTQLKTHLTVPDWVGPQHLSHEAEHDVWMTLSDYHSCWSDCGTYWDEEHVEGQVETEEELLVLQGTSADASAEDQNAALRCAVQNGDEATVALLLGKGISVNTVDSLGVTPLIRATQARQKAVVALLIEKHASIDAADEKGRTALMCAIQTGAFYDGDVAQLLLENGAALSPVVECWPLPTANMPDWDPKRLLWTFLEDHCCPNVMAEQAKGIMELLVNDAFPDAAHAAVVENALHALSFVNLDAIVARNKVIARLLSHLDRKYPGVHQPLLATFAPVTRSVLIEAVAARRYHEAHEVRKAALACLQMLLPPLNLFTAPPSLLVYMAGTATEERRVDPSDGGAYTKSEFIEEYGGTAQWDAAQIRVNHADRLQ